MCKKHNPRKIDECMINLIDSLQIYNVPTRACCCGHGKYPMTIIVQTCDGRFFEICHNKFIPRKRRFYKKDKQGYYYIPEVLEK